jgi:hypothetical protein
LGRPISGLATDSVSKAVPVKAFHRWDTQLRNPRDTLASLCVPLSDKALKTWKMCTPPLGTIRLLRRGLWSAVGAKAPSWPSADLSECRRRQRVLNRLPDVFAVLDLLRLSPVSAQNRSQPNSPLWNNVQMRRHRSGIQIWHVGHHWLCDSMTWRR